MHRRILFVFLCVSLLAGIAFHFGPGQTLMTRDRALLAWNSASRELENGNSLKAKEHLRRALEWIPESDRRLRPSLMLDDAILDLQLGNFKSAYSTLRTLRERTSEPAGLGSHQRDPHFIAKVDQALASVQFFGGWSMRLRGYPVSDWLPYLESSRQIYRGLASSAAASEETKKRYQLDGEAVIALSRISSDDLKGYEPRIVKLQRDQELPRGKSGAGAGAGDGIPLQKKPEGDDGRGSTRGIAPLPENGS